MKKIIVPIIGVLIIIGIYLVTLKKENTQHKKEQQQLYQQELSLKEEKQIEKLENLEILITKSYENKDLNRLKYFQDMLQKDKINNKYELVSGKLDHLISVTYDYINQTQEYYQNVNLEQQKSACLNKLNSYKTNLLNFSNSDLEKIKSSLSNNECNKYISDDITSLIVEINDVIANKREQQENFKNSCINEYNYLEKKFQEAIGPINDDEDKIADVKVEAIKLKNNGCDTYLGNSLNELIEKCNKEL